MLRMRVLWPPATCRSMSIKNQITVETLPQTSWFIKYHIPYNTRLQAIYIIFVYSVQIRLLR